MAVRSGERDMSVGKPWVVILQFASFLFLSQFFQQMYNMVDSLIVGNFLGKEALAAVGSSSNLILLIIGVITGTAMGAGVVIAQFFGARDDRRLSAAIHTITGFGILAGLFLTVFGVLATPTILRWMGVTAEVLPNSIAYFRYYFLGALAQVMYNVFTAILNAVGDSKHPLYYLMITTVLNIVLDLLFIGVFHFGVGSAAVATSISQTVSCLLCLAHLLRADAVYRLELRKIRIEKKMLGFILKNGLPTGVQNSVISLGNVLVQTNINSFGTDAMAACGAYAKVCGFVFLPVTGCAMAMATFVGQNLGAHRQDRVRQGARFGIAASMLMAEAFGVLLFVEAPRLIGLFNTDPEVVRIGVMQCRIEALFFFLLAFSHCIAGICRGAGKALVPMIIMLAVWCVFRSTFIIVMMRIVHDIQYLFWAYPLTWSISSVLFLIYYKKSNWIQALE